MQLAAVVNKIMGSQLTTSSVLLPAFMYLKMTWLHKIGFIKRFPHFLGISPHKLFSRISFCLKAWLGLMS